MNQKTRQWVKERGDSKIDICFSLLEILLSAYDPPPPLPLFRQMIRLTWGNPLYLQQINASLLFVVGRYPSLKIQFTLEQESRK
jgi:hypothetical protein